MPPRFYASTQYLLPADEAETTRLDLQHRVIVRAFENRLTLAPLTLKAGDRVLESGAGSGIWALEFFENNKGDGVLVDMECIDITDRQFPSEHPSNVHFSIHSVADLPADWNEMFSYIHQRLMVGAFNDYLWRKAIAELFRVLQRDKWIELVELDMNLHFGVGPSSNKLQALISVGAPEMGTIADIAVYVPSLLRENGFVDIQCETRTISISRTGEDGYRSDQWRDLWLGMKDRIISRKGFGYVETEQEYEELLQECIVEWNNSGQASATFHTILARKP
ncbi:hypothetical protein GYMLUDRAFT_165142 [Collybiopsis luxurians FD-317 M1]|uniref:S-adenosyl-L-methionine-dependent methyltransferase n=1 Tax=Collybiopsis luxurians FD-317 M1 TaxID=944289 RepID=A0A0D0C2E6_9AGAR|nr:hypothetical protein GYMLUDRAFT_165142 [Collybiopsis luxurians FD-317 M1]